VVPALEAALGHAGRFLSFQFLVCSFSLAKKGRAEPGLYMDSSPCQGFMECHDLQSRRGCTTFTLRDDKFNRVAV
jgi:hypothetical protein